LTLKKFLTKIEKLEEIKGISEVEFDPLDYFIKTEKKIPKIAWTIPEVLSQRTIFY
jgi:hypothetical protein